MHILVMFTGGTIGSSVSDGYIRVDGEKGFRLLEYYKKKVDAQYLPAICDFTTVQPFQTLSENMTCKKVADLVNALKKELGEREYDGVIICHGTDTLQYSAAMAGFCFGLSSIPIVFVSSNYVLDDERANGLYNFAGAVSFIAQGGSHGVFVAYKNAGETVKIHRATRTVAHLPYSDLVFSVKDTYYGSFEGNIFGEHSYVANPDYFENKDELAPMPVDQIKNWESDILEIYPATGFTYPDIKDKTNLKAILHHTYHAGTICAETPGIEEFVNQAAKRNIPIFLTGADPDMCYESMSVYEKLGIHVLPVASPTAMYMKLFLCMNNGMDAMEVMYKNLGGDLEC